MENKNVITSKSNSIYKDFLKYKHGDKDSCLFLAEGEDLFYEADKNNCIVSVALLDKSNFDTKGYKCFYFGNELYRTLSCYQSLPKVICLCRKKLNQNVGDRVIYLDGIQDPGNFGTILRTALSFNYTGVVFSYDCVSLFNSKVIQSSKGALFHLPIWKEDLKYYKEKGYNIYITTLDGENEKKIEELNTPFVLAFGNEGHGIREENLNLGKKLKIEMSSIDSLNVAVSSGIFMYRFQKKGDNK